VSIAEHLKPVRDVLQMGRDESAANRSAVLTVVALGHVVFVVILLRLDGATGLQREQNTSPLLLLDLFLSTKSPPTPVRDGAKAAKPKAGDQNTHVLPTPQTQSTIGSTAPSRAEAPSADSLNEESPIDWYGEAEQVAKAQSILIFKELKQLCDAAALRGEHRAECRKYKKPDAWAPEPRKFGIAGGLPYVRLGKRCILGLGFFGCGIGKLPEASGHIFDDMRDPDRPRSSVPDPNE
jgi:hypothetical protein